MNLYKITIKMLKGVIVNVYVSADDHESAVDELYDFMSRNDVCFYESIDEVQHVEDRGVFIGGTPDFGVRIYKK